MSLEEFSYPYHYDAKSKTYTSVVLVDKAINGALNILPKMIHDCCKIIRGYDINSYSLLFNMGILLECIEVICKHNDLFELLDVMVNIKFERMRRRLEDE